jgi:hypothetical protein
VEAFTCFIKSEHEQRGMDCLAQFKTFQVDEVPACLPAGLLLWEERVISV